MSSLARHLEAAGHRLDVAQPARRFAGGFGNLNYLLRVDGEPAVLRRPPLGPIPPGANDMAREHLILSRLAPYLSLVPRAIHFCAEPSILGAPFLIMQYRPGLVIGGDALPAHLATPDVGKHLSQRLVGFLAELHAVDPAAIGLGDLGRPEGFLQRAVAGWSRRADIALDGERSALVSDVAGWLAARVPASTTPATLLHNDFKLDNMVLDPDTLAARSVLDWDMGSRGDPLFDVATTLSYWTEPGDPACMHRLAQMPTAQPGFLTRAEVLNDYARRTGRDVEGFAFYRVLGMFKLGVVFLQLSARRRAGGAIDPRLAGLDGLGLGLLEFAQDIAHARAL